MNHNSIEDVQISHSNLSRENIFTFTTSSNQEWEILPHFEVLASSSVINLDKTKVIKFY